MTVGAHQDACPICGRSAPVAAGRIGHRHLARCRGCGHEFVSGHSAAALAEEYRSAYYAGASDPRIDAWAAAHGAVWDAIVDQIHRLHPSASRFLDVGSGSGGFLARLRLRHPQAKLAAVEPSASAREALSGRMPDVAFVADEAEQLDQVEDRFDVVTMLQTLEHLADPVAALRGAFTCLHPGGLLFATVPNRRSLSVLLHGRRADCFANGTHLQFFTRKSLMDGIRRAGFVAPRRIVHFGGGQHAGLLGSLVQYLARLGGVSNELRVAARRGDRAGAGATRRDAGA